jgi:hypothetical protein
MRQKDVDGATSLDPGNFAQMRTAAAALVQ